MYFHTDDERTIAWLANVLATCVSDSRRVRFDVSPNGELKVKVGEGIWSAPIHSAPDPYRDAV